MSDWRSKPRTGKAQFLKHLPSIRIRIEAGETQTAIRTDLCQDAGLQISAAQFSRYLKAFCPAVKACRDTISSSTLVESIPQNSVEKVKPAKTNDQAKPPEQKSAIPPRKPMTPADFRKIREDTDKLDLDALVSGRGLIYDDEQKR